MILTGASDDEWWQRLAGLPGVADEAGRARDLVDRLLTSRMLRARTADVLAATAAAGARASARLEGVDPDVDGVVLAGCLRVRAELPRLRSVWRTSPTQALARLHLLAAAGLVPDESLGRPGSAQDARSLMAIATLARTPGRPVALLLAAVVHGELASAAPFGPGSGVVARAAARLVLADRGLDPDLLVPVEVGHVEQGDYARALAGYAGGGQEGVAQWLRHCAAAVGGGAQEGLAAVESLARG